MNDTMNIIYTSIQLLLGVLFGIFSFIMIKELYEGLDADSSFIDYKLGKLYENRNLYDEFIEVMGGTFGIHWFLPFKQGGFKNVFNIINKKI